MKKRTRNLKVMSILMSVLLILNSLSFYAVAQDTAAVEPEEAITTAGGLELKADNDNIYKKIHFYLGDSEEATIDDADELAKATSKLQQRSANLKEVQVTVQFESDFMNTDEYKAFAKERENLNSIEEVRNFRVRLNSYSKEYHTALATKGTALLGKIEYNSITPIEYSPFVVMKMDTAKVTASNLVSVAEYKNVVSISVDCEEQPVSMGESVAQWGQEEWDEMLLLMNAFDIVNNRTYSGWGIRVGIYEAGGICNTSHPKLADKDITTRDTTTGETPHATAVTATLTEIAPNAQYYVSDVYCMGIQWFIDNYCDIINCSFGYTGNTEINGVYTEGPREYRLSIDGVYDYQVAYHFVTVLIASGDRVTCRQDAMFNPEGKITSPAYAYNVITIGGVKKSPELDGGSIIIHDDYAAYVTPTEISKPNICKPTISAFSQVTIPDLGTGYGTSFSTPIVTACLTLLLEYDWSYITYPERMMSVLVSTAQKTDDYVEDMGNFDSRIGAGLIDLQRMIDNDQSLQMHNTDGISGTEIVWVDVDLDEGDELQVGLAWLVTAINSSSTAISITNILVTDYDLIIYHPSGLVTTSIHGNSNVEMVRLTAEVSGTYSIGIYQSSYLDPGIDMDFLSLTYNVIS